MKYVLLQIAEFIFEIYETPALMSWHHIPNNKHVNTTCI